MKKNLIFLALAAIGLASCNGGFKKGDHGLLYNINVDKSGTNIKTGDFVNVNLTIKNDADSVLLSSYELGHSFPLYSRPQLPGDVFDAFTSLSEGDSVTVKVLGDSVYKNKGQRPFNFTGKYLTYSLKIEKVIAKGTQTDQVFHDAVANYMKGEGDKMKAKEPAAIQKYITDNKLNVTKTATGLNYVITKPGTGPLPNAGDTVYVNYVGRFTNGKVFETSIKEEAIKAKTYSAQNPYQPISLPIGQGKVIPGWDQGIMLLNKGAKATFVIPSDLAYKDQGNQVIGPYTPLVFEIELVNIKPADPNAPKPANPILNMPAPGKAVGPAKTK